MVVTIEKALEFIYENTHKKSTILLPIEQALGFIIAQNVKATHNLPPYDNSAMDGYAVMIENSGECVKVEHTIFAGDNSDVKLETGHAIKIMTGAKIPYGTQCIVPVEDTIECEGGVQLPDNLILSKHIRLQGEDIASGFPILEDGEKLTAYQITLLASQGVTHVKVYKRPKIALFASGNELKMHFEDVASYQLYNTNTPMLLARAKELGCDVEFIGTAHDTMEDIKEHIKASLDADLIVTSGGVSVGDADFTKEAFGEFGYEIYFDKVAIKPGKPTTFGKVKDTLILNLPGNPMAAAMNFELFGQSIILALSGTSSKYIKPITTTMSHDYKLRAGRRTLVPGYFDGENFKVCEKFTPGMISPLAVSNAYIMIDESCGFLAEGTKVNIIPTNFSFTSKTQHSLITK